MSKPTIIFVPGSWQKPSAYADILKALQDSGYPAVHVPLPTVGGSELPLAGLSDDVDAVRKVLVPMVEDGKEVVVIGHSSGGISMSAAVERYDALSRKAAGKSGGVVQCIYMTAFVLPKAQSLLGMLGGQPLPWMVVEVSSVEAKLWYGGWRDFEQKLTCN
jgi:pimeloyl-ACP methyl ester carboxylesterase